MLNKYIVSFSLKGDDEKLQGDCRSTRDGKRQTRVSCRLASSPRPATAGPAHGHRHLFEDVLLPHQLLPFPVGLGDHDVEDVLPIVGDIADKEHQVLQQLDDKPSQKDMRVDQCEALTVGKPLGPTTCSHTYHG